MPIKSSKKNRISRKRSTRKRTTHKRKISKRKSNSYGRRSRKSQYIPRASISRYINNTFYFNDLNAVEKLASPYFLTISDIMKLKPNDKIDLMIFDRNFGDVMNLKGASGTQTKPSEVFAGSKATYIHSHDLKGLISFTFDNTPRVFEFELEYMPGYWYPLTNGAIHSLMPEYERGLPEGKKWTEFPKNTKVGWRGPSMLWRDLDKLPDLEWIGPTSDVYY